MAMTDVDIDPAAEAMKEKLQEPFQLALELAIISVVLALLFQLGYVPRKFATDGILAASLAEAVRCFVTLLYGATALFNQ